MRRIYYCGDLERIGFWNTRWCCGSCHEDHDEGYDLYMVEIDLPGTEDFLRVCCAVKRDLEQLGIHLDLERVRHHLEGGEK